MAGIRSRTRQEQRCASDFRSTHASGHRIFLGPHFFRLEMLNTILTHSADYSIVRFFLVKKPILESMGIIEIPVMLMMEEAVEFVFPAVIQILKNRMETGGDALSSLHVLNCC